VPGPDDHLPLAPHVFEILLALSQGPRHGYGIIAEVRERTGGAVLIGTSSLYAAIRRMLADGLVAGGGKQPDEASGGPPRRYYRITTLGIEVARLEAERLRKAAKAAEKLLDASLARSRS
jgi:DNA-binding PadR family transcriptional regulator